MTHKQPIQIIFLPGNGGATINDHWFPWLKLNLTQLGFDVIAKNFPDSLLARKKYWLPFIQNTLQPNKRTILIGHSTGAIAAMKYAESNPIYASILVAPYHTHLNDYHEKISGYFNNAWQWKNIKKNQNWIVQFNSLDDPYVPIQEGRAVHNFLNSEYYEYHKHGHFGDDIMKTKFPEIVSVIKKKFGIE